MKLVNGISKSWYYSSLFFWSRSWYYSLHTQYKGHKDPGNNERKELYI